MKAQHKQVLPLTKGRVYVNREANALNSMKENKGLCIQGQKDKNTKKMRT